MLGIPLEPYPEYPQGHSKIFLTQSAAKNPQVIDKIEESLRNGGDVIITSGLVKALTDKGLGQLANIRWSGNKAQVNRYGMSRTGLNLDAVAVSDKAILLPWMNYSNNDVWPLAEGLVSDNNIPVLIAVNYGKGHLFILTIPDDQGDLYHYPREVLNLIRKTLKGNCPVSIDANAKIGLFTYDNDTFVVESFLPYPEDIKVVIDRQNAKLVDLVTGLEIEGLTSEDTTTFKVNLQQATYKAFRIK